VVALGDGGGVAPAGRRPITGAVQVARLITGLFRRAAKEAATVARQWILVNGDLGLLFEITHPERGALRLVMGFACDGGRITGVFSQVNPAKLTGVPALARDLEPGPRGR
jgi:RNA polymerase sigma-70 factor (ECF subfamily)